jgi:hypothetical protein
VDGLAKMLKYELLMVASEATYTYSKGNRQIQKVPTVFALKLRALYITLSHYIFFFIMFQWICLKHAGTPWHPSFQCAMVEDLESTC